MKNVVVGSVLGAFALFAGSSAFAAQTDFAMAGRSKAELVDYYSDFLGGQQNKPFWMNSPGKCVEWGEMSVLLSPDSDSLGIRKILERLPDPAAVRYQRQSAWSQTASNPSVTARNPITITYSFVPDGTMIPGSNGEPAAVSEWFATMNDNFPGGETAWRAQYAAALGKWGAITGINYVETTDDGASFPNSPGVLGVRGDVRVSMHFIDGASGSNILAYNFFPNNGDVVFDTDNIDLWTSSSGNFRGLRNVIMHEHGHGLGFAHVMPVVQTKLMEPFLSTAFDGPQEDDTRGGQFQYGDNFEANNNAGTATPVTLLDPSGAIPTFVTINDVALETQAVQDWYSFPLQDNARLSLFVEPIGTSYLEGPQVSPEQNTTTNAKNISDLAIDVVAPDGTTVLLSQTSGAIGTSELIDSFDATSVNGAGTYYARVRATAGSNASQRYRIRFGWAFPEQSPTPTPPPSPTPIPTATPTPTPTNTPSPTPTPTPSNQNDADKDGFGDGIEASQGTNDRDPASRPDYGDFDRDGGTTLRDAIVLYRFVSQGGEANTDRYDLNLDGAVDLADARILYFWSVGSQSYPIIPKVQ